VEINNEDPFQNSVLENAVLRMSSCLTIGEKVPFSTMFKNIGEKPVFSARLLSSLLFANI
jgi:hypothetical protein